MIRLLCECRDDGKPGCAFECETCNGDGTHPDGGHDAGYDVVDGRSVREISARSCPDCGGVGERVCGNCDGRGWLECDERFYEPGLFVSTIASVEAA